MNSINGNVSSGSSDQLGIPNIAINAQRVADTLATGNQVSESFTEAFKF